jgi:hypothetical protein
MATIGMSTHANLKAKHWGRINTILSDSHSLQHMQAEKSSGESIHMHSNIQVDIRLAALTFLNGKELRELCVPVRVPLFFATFFPCSVVF